jgi:hypothetical protein
MVFRISKSPLNSPESQLSNETKITKNYHQVTQLRLKNPGPFFLNFVIVYLGLTAELQQFKRK